MNPVTRTGRLGGAGRALPNGLKHSYSHDSVSQLPKVEHVTIRWNTSTNQPPGALASAQTPKSSNPPPPFARFLFRHLSARSTRRRDIRGVPRRSARTPGGPLLGAGDRQAAARAAAPGGERSRCPGFEAAMGSMGGLRRRT